MLTQSKKPKQPSDAELARRKEQRDRSEQQPPPEWQKYLTLPQAAVLSRRSRATLYKDIAAGRLVAVKVGGRTFIERAAIDRMFANAPRLPAAAGL